MSTSTGTRILSLLLCLFLFGGATAAQAKTSKHAMHRAAPHYRAVPLPKPRLLIDMSNPRNCLARAVYVEARGEPLDGQLMVGYVIRYRTLLDSPGFGGRVICKAIYAKAQIDGIKGKAWAPGELNAWQVALAVAGEVMSGRFVPAGELRYATHYLRPEKSGVAGKCWFESTLKPIAWVGNHLFYREPLPYEKHALHPSFDCSQQVAKR